jgi:hypothetical protein
MNKTPNVIVSVADIRKSGNWHHFASNYSCGYWKEEKTFDPDDMVGIKHQDAKLYGLA